MAGAAVARAAGWVPPRALTRGRSLLTASASRPGSCWSPCRRSCAHLLHQLPGRGGGQAAEDRPVRGRPGGWAGRLGAWAGSLPLTSLPSLHVQLLQLWEKNGYFDDSIISSYRARLLGLASTRCALLPEVGAGWCPRVLGSALFRPNSQGCPGERWEAGLRSSTGAHPPQQPVSSRGSPGQVSPGVP